MNQPDAWTIELGSVGFDFDENGKASALVEMSLSMPGREPFKYRYASHSTVGVLSAARTAFANKLFEFCAEVEGTILPTHIGVDRPENVPDATFIESVTAVATTEGSDRLDTWMVVIRIPSSIIQVMAVQIPWENGNDDPMSVVAVAIRKASRRLQNLAEQLASDVDFPLQSET